MKLRRSILPFMAVCILLFFMFDFDKGKIDYEIVRADRLPKAVHDYYVGLTPGATGMFEFEKHSYALITTTPDEKVEVEFIGSAEDGIGKEIRYGVLPNDDKSQAYIVGNYAVWIVKLEKVVSTPFGFNNLDL